MNISRREFTNGALAVAAASLAPIGRARAQAVSVPAVHFVSGFPRGSGAESVIRFYAEKMRPALGGNVVVDVIDELPGVPEGSSATKLVAAAKPDGTTIYLTAGGVIAANQHVFKVPPVPDLAAALQGFGTITHAPLMLLVRADSPYKTLPELTAAMKKKGKAARFGVPNGSIVRVVAGLYPKLAGLTDVTKVQYQASTDIVGDLTSGAVDFMFTNNVFAFLMEKQGKARILAMSSTERMKSKPDYPTFKEFGYPINVDGWWGGFVPKATPRPIVDRLGKILSAAVMTDDSVKFLHDTASEPWLQTPDQTEAMLRRQVSDYAKDVKLAGLDQQ